MKNIFSLQIFFNVNKLDIMQKNLLPRSFPSVNIEKSYGDLKKGCIFTNAIQPVACRRRAGSRCEGAPFYNLIVILSHFLGFNHAGTLRRSSNCIQNRYWLIILILQSTFTPCSQYKWQKSGSLSEISGFEVFWPLVDLWLTPTFTFGYLKNSSLSHNHIGTLVVKMNW